MGKRCPGWLLALKFRGLNFLKRRITWFNGDIKNSGSGHDVNLLWLIWISWKSMKFLWRASAGFGLEPGLQHQAEHRSFKLFPFFLRNKHTHAKVEPSARYRFVARRRRGCLWWRWGLLGSRGAARWRWHGDRAWGQGAGPRVRRSVMRFCICGGNGPLGRRFGGTEELGQNEERKETEKNNPSLSSFRTCMWQGTPLFFLFFCFVLIN